MGDWWLVCSTLPFGWKNSPFVYQTIGLAATNYFRSVGIACFLYIDDRLNGEIFTNEGYWSKPVGERDAVFSKQSAEADLYIVCRPLIQLGYILGLKKCVLMPVNCITFLGMEVNSSLQAFQIPASKKASFAVLREEILSGAPTVPLKTLQRFMGKASSFTLAFPGAKFSIREMAAAIGSASSVGCSENDFST